MHILRIMSKEILAEKISAEAKPNLRDIKERVSWLISIGKRLSLFSEGITQVTVKMTDLRTICESVFGLRMKKEKGMLIRHNKKDNFDLLLDNWHDQIRTRFQQQSKICEVLIQVFSRKKS